MTSLTIYSTPTCRFCKQLKAFLAENNIEYTDHDVMADEDAIKEMQELSGGNMSVPFIVFNKGEENQETQSGFDAEKVRAALSL